MKRITARMSFALALCLLMAATFLPAKEKVDKKHKGSGGGTYVAVEVFIGKDQELVRNHYAKYPGQLPPGLAKRGGELPPGLEKQLQRKGRLPPGLQKKLTPFPIELEKQLSPLKKGLLRGVIDGQAVIYDRKSMVVLDVFAVL